MAKYNNLLQMFKKLIEIDRACHQNPCFLSYDSRGGRGSSQLRLQRGEASELSLVCIITFLSPANQQVDSSV